MLTSYSTFSLSDKLPCEQPLVIGDPIISGKYAPKHNNITAAFDQRFSGLVKKILIIITHMAGSGRLIWLARSLNIGYGKYRRPLIRSVALLAALSLPFAADSKETLPVPSGIPGQLFYLQRDPDENTVIYKLNVVNGRLDDSNPIHVFWIRYAERGQVQELTTLQRKLAYGINARLIEKGKYELRIVSYPRIPLYLISSTDGRNFCVYAIIGSRKLMLNRVFVGVKNRSFSLPKIEFIELSGRDAANGEEMKHRITI